MSVAVSQMYYTRKVNLFHQHPHLIFNFFQWLSSIHEPVVLVAFNARSDANAFCRALIANDTEEYGRRKVIQRFDTLSSLE